MEHGAETQAAVRNKLKCDGYVRLEETFFGGQEVDLKMARLAFAETCRNLPPDSYCGALISREGVDGGENLITIPEVARLHPRFVGNNAIYERFTLERPWQGWIVDDTARSWREQWALLHFGSWPALPRLRKNPRRTSSQKSKLITKCALSKTISRHHSFPS